jgi:thiosulfate dehydrogenase
MGRGIIAGVIVTLVVGLIAAYLFVELGFMPANADGNPPAVEKWMARASLRASIQREAPKEPNPQALNDENLVSGIKVYAVNCAVCHGASDGVASNIAVGLYQKAPQLAKDGVEDDPDGKIYWKIKHGIRLTGMPAFSGTLNDQQIWQLTLFLKNMDSLPSAAAKVWKAVPSAATRIN